MLRLCRETTKSNTCKVCYMNIRDWQDTDNPLIYWNTRGYLQYKYNIIYILIPL